MTNEELLEKIQKRFDALEQGQAHTNITVAQIKTAVETLAAGQQDLREKVGGLAAGQKAIRHEMATKADVQDIKATLVKHQRRIENLEEQTSTPNPHKN